MRRRFEFNEDRSSKFWEIELDGTNVNTWWGWIKTQPEQHTKECESAEEARELYDRLIADKQRVGFEEKLPKGGNKRSEAPSVDAAQATGDVQSAWNEIESWLSNNAPKIMDNLNPGASDEDLRRIDELVGEAMPKEWRDLYLAHDGMNDSGNLGSLFYGYEFLSLERVHDELESQIGLDEDDLPVRIADKGVNKANMHNLKWVPFAHDGGDTLLRLDLDPGSGGTKGQVIFTDHEVDAVIVLASSISELLKQFGNDLNKGLYWLDEDALADGNEFLKCDDEVDVCNWSNSLRWEYLRKRP